MNLNSLSKFNLSFLAKVN